METPCKNTTEGHSKQVARLLCTLIKLCLVLLESIATDSQSTRGTYHIVLHDVSY